MAADAIRFSPQSTVPQPLQVSYVHADHLGTPRAITRPSDNAVLWRWDNANPFGANAAEDNPSTLGVFGYNLRFPGQYRDRETGWHYNYFRDYEPTTGRYLQSDPIGLAGGLNTYAYTDNRPLTSIDPKGLSAITGGRVGAGVGGFLGGPVGAGIGAILGVGIAYAIMEACQEDTKNDNCSKASKWQLEQAGVTDEREYKEGWVGKGRISRYDICACQDGRIVIKAAGGCGKRGPAIETYDRWK